jgi:hypothetical protein
MNSPIYDYLNRRIERADKLLAESHKILSEILEEIQDLNIQLEAQLIANGGEVCQIQD